MKSIRDSQPDGYYLASTAANSEIPGNHEAGGISYFSFPTMFHGLQNTA